MKLLKKLLIILIVIIAVVAVSTIGVYVFVRTKYDIDLFSTVKELKILTEDVDENKLCPNIIKDEDFPNMKNTVNSAVRGLVKDNVEEGYKGYYLDYKGLTLNIQKKTLVLDEQNLVDTPEQQQRHDSVKQAIMLVVDREQQTADGGPDQVSGSGAGSHRDRKDQCRRERCSIGQHKAAVGSNAKHQYFYI